MPNLQYLNPEQLKQYNEQGFVVLENAIDATDIATLKAAALEIVDDFDIEQNQSVFSTRDRDAGRDEYFFDSAENCHCFLEADALNDAGQLTTPARLAINKIGHAMHDLNPAFRHFCKLPVFAQSMRDIGYRQPVLWQSMYIFKQPSIGGEVRWHQDASYLISEPHNVTGIWVAIEDAHQGNGCLWVQPGGHKSPLREIYQVDWSRRKGQLKTLDSTPWPTTDEAIPLELKAGSLVIFHDRMPHYSSQNTSEFSRHAFTLHIAEAGSNWSPDNWLQRPVLGQFKL